jgi:KUP system potassium uptake protein
MLKRGTPGGVAAAVGALGIVFGDIGTSPLYTYQTVVNTKDATFDRVMVMGTTSMIIWALLLIVTVLYVRLLMRTDNAGEGGLLALFGLLRLREKSPRVIAICAALAMVGAAMFLGDSVITPAVSVLSAVDGIATFDAGLNDLVVPISVAILAVLFLMQRFGTAKIGRMFGPIMIVWFVIAGVMGLFSLVKTPSILTALSPHWIVLLVAQQPSVAFFALGGVILAITGAEALYADMGHFGRKPIVAAWLFAVFPALVLNYLGQGAEVLRSPGTSQNPFWDLIPRWATIPVVVIATLGTIIASQAVISGSFSVVHQASRLGLLPHLRVLHTSGHNVRQIYLPAVNLLLAAVVLTLVLTFQNSNALTDAYGLAVTMTIVITTTIFLVLRHQVKPWSVEILIGGLIWVIMLFFLASNLLKIPTGGWLPLTIGAALTVVMSVWSWGRRRLRSRIAADAATANQSISLEMDEHVSVERVPGTAVYPAPAPGMAPLALRSMLDFTSVLHENVLVLHSKVSDLAIVPHDEQLKLTSHGRGVYELDGLTGYWEHISIPDLVAKAADRFPELKEVEPGKAIYLISQVSPSYRSKAVLPTWRQRFFIGLYRLAPAGMETLGLPPGRTVAVDREVQI